MYSLFGTKFVKLFSGPMWRVEVTSQDNDSEPNQSRLTSMARTNVPGLSERTLQRRIADSGIVRSSEIQTLMLDAATKAKPDATWWIKGDACDVVPGLCESVDLKWSGDVDMNDGKVMRDYQAYKSQLEVASNLGLHARRCRQILNDDLCTLHQQILKDKDFLVKELDSASCNYHKKLESNPKDTKCLFALGWRVEELQQLVENCQTLIATVATLCDASADPQADFGVLNIPNRLDKFRNSLTSFLHGLSRHQRQKATHIFVFMISCDQRDSKPYALPVQCLPCCSLTNSKLRQLLNVLIKEMKSRGMKVAGFSSDGEFNSLRNRGYTRPLSVFAIRSDVRSKYARMSQSSMKLMLTPIAQPGGRIVAVKSNPAISTELLTEIFKWQIQGQPWSDTISRLRPRTVPPGFAFSKWKPGEETETDEQMLRSILAQLKFTYVVRKYDDEGIPFRSHLHVPEHHPLTGSIFYEREDEGHVLKRIARCTRGGGPAKLQLERYQEAVQCSEAGLTYTALVGTRKQSVQDAERMFSPSLLKFMETKGYQYEAKYIRAILGWRQSCDTRGLSQLQRCKGNYQMLNLILEELMPWANECNYDYSLLEVNRSVSGVCGFTREVLSALVADIETREWRRCLNHSPEHPRASTTDDVECFFSVMRDMVGTHFTVKQAQFAWRKVCIEFEKRIDDNLPFYYFTFAHDRFYEGKRVSFDEPSKKKRPPRLPRCEQGAAASMDSGRCDWPVKGTLLLRPKFHKHAANVPPPSTSQILTVEHSY